MVPAPAGRDEEPALTQASGRARRLAASLESIEGVEPDDHELVEALRRLDSRSFDRLYERYFHRIYNFVYARIRNHADAEEIVQETFTAVFRSIDAFRSQSTLLSWIYGIAKNTVNNHLRRARLREQWIELAELESLVPITAPGDSPEDEVSLRRYARRIEQRLGSLASWQAEVFVLRHVDNLPIREIARRTDRSSDAIRSSLYRVKRLLVEANEGDVQPAAS